MLNSSQEFFIESGLYAKVPLEILNKGILFEILLRPSTIDGYCVECGQRSTYRPVPKDLPQLELYGGGIGVGIPLRVNSAEIFEKNWEKILDNYKHRPLNQQFLCSRDESHKLFFHFWIDHQSLQKIGQYPSLSDLSQPEIQKYRKILGRDRYQEFNRGIGLFTHGIGIGSFVYLRRIFENLIEEAHVEASQHAEWDEGTYLKARMAERISLLKGYIPDVLIELKAMYSVLSKGIHELDEQYCLEIFPAVKAGIDLILDEKISKKEREEKKKQATQAISHWQAKLGTETT